MISTGGRKSSVDGVKLTVEQFAKGVADRLHAQYTIHNTHCTIHIPSILIIIILKRISTNILISISVVLSPEYPNTSLPSTHSDHTDDCF